ncbi:MAG: DUF6077 domain-containing protein [bacterium]|nr:DUF6077 domain-containing protein [bacterium]
MTKNYCFTDIIASAVILLIGGAEAAHLYGVFPGGTLGKCCVLFAVLTALALAALTGAVFICRRSRPQDGTVTNTPWTKGEWILLAVFLTVVMTQLFYLFSGRSVYRQGDMTLETVGSFLECDGIYRTNPMTGNAYEAGLPRRIEILCLPTLYAMICRIFSARPETVIRQIIPPAALICCYAAYFCVGRSLFPKDRRRRLCFLAVTALLIWVGSYRYGMDGFGILYCGWRGTVWRNAVLIPYTFSLCLRRKYGHAFLCVLAEACIVWTLYGMGACLTVIAGMALIDFFRGKRKARKESKR